MQTAARPYARAIFAGARQSPDAMQQWMSLLEFLALCVCERRFVGYLNNPSVPRGQKLDHLLKMLQEREISVQDEHKNFLTLLLQAGRFSQIPFIAEIFRQMKLQTEKTEMARVRSAHPLSDEDKRSLEDSLTGFRKNPVIADVVVDESLLGGVVIELGGLSWDYSIRGKLAKLSNNL